jgi:hypothetical protein
MRRPSTIGGLPVSSLGDVQDLLQRMNAVKSVLLVHGEPCLRTAPDAKFYRRGEKRPLVVSFNRGG